MPQLNRHGAHHVWIDHNHITRMNDGLIDTTYLTVSWNIIAEGRKASGIGWTPNASRNPSTDNVAHAHLYNNYLQNITGYGNYARGATKMVIENCYTTTRRSSGRRAASAPPARARGRRAAPPSRRARSTPTP
ncbi:hypothetical protein [Herbidospora yilanensis]|uniref:hypothetical protein n=1 Tax=Herbidospora yilanensis TaxID=354426 RepID=UPI000A5BAC4C|nr:hypothetical protein [Herbidospora yilanensis]